MVTIRDCGVDPEIRDLVPAHSWQESAELGASVERFGYLAPIVVWRNPAGELVVLDGHKRRERWLAAWGAAQKTGGSAPDAPQVTEIEFASREDAMLWVIDNQTGRRNLSDLDRIALVAKREQIVRRLADANRAAGLKRGVVPPVSALLPKRETIDTRAESAKAAGVGEKTYDAGKQIIAAVPEGKLPPTVVEDIRSGKASIHGIAKGLKGESHSKPASKSKVSGWKASVSKVFSVVRKLVRRDPNRRAERAAELRRLADELQADEKAAA